MSSFPPSYLSEGNAIPWCCDHPSLRQCTGCAGKEIKRVHAGRTEDLEGVFPKVVLSRPQLRKRKL